MADDTPNRRLAAVLSADVVGYSRLMSADEDGTVRTLSAYRDQVRVLVEQHRGRVADFTGDNFLAEFPSALDAVQCAVEIQRVLEARNSALSPDYKLQFRMGVNLGDIREEGGRLYGAGINIAARLEALADPGGICIAEPVYTQVRRRVGVGFEDMGLQALKNIPEPVRAYRVHLHAPPASATTAVPPPQRPRPVWPAVAALVLAVAGVLYFRGRSETPAPPPTPAAEDKPAIAVLPFANMSGDPEQEYFADGMTEDLITDLSKVSGLFVIARNSVFTYKGKPTNVQDVARDLDVQYVLEGSVRKAGDRVRITAQLVDGATGHHLWSDRYDRNLTDIFALQDEVTQAIMSELRVALTPDERARVAHIPTADPDAYDLAMRGLAAYWNGSRASNDTARTYFEEAIARDPTYAEAYAMIAGTDMEAWANQWTQDPAVLRRAQEQAQRALSLNPQLGYAHAVVGVSSLFAHDFARAEAAGERAVALEPGNPQVLQLVTYIFSGVGRYSEALQLLDGAVRLNPNQRAMLGYEYGATYVLLRRFDQAIVHLREFVTLYPNFVRGHALLARTYAEMGELAAAREAARELLRLSPDWTIAGMAGRLPYRDPAVRARVTAAYRKAGLPEGEWDVGAAGAAD